MSAYLQAVLGTSAVDLALALPLLVWAYMTATPRGGLQPVLLFMLFVTIDVALVFSSRIMPLIPAWGHWNWQGKLLEAAVPLVLVLLMPAEFPAARMGLMLPERRQQWWALPCVCLAYLLIFIPVALLLLGAHLGFDSDLPKFVYEATMPGLGEEIFYRGLLLMLLNRAFGRPWKFAGIQLGWGFIVVTALFGILHGVEVKPGAPMVFNVSFTAMLFPAATGVMLAWLRERTGSVWPGAVFHNFVNVFNQFLV